MPIAALLELTVVQGTHLPSKDIIGQSDPFCVVSYGRKIFKTRKIENNANPRWDERLVTLVGQHQTTYDITFGVYDHDVDNNDFIGNASLSLSAYSANQLHDIILDLKDPKGNKAGEIIITLQLSTKEVLETRFWSQLFEVIDVDGSGNLCIEELQLAFQILGHAALPHKDLENLFKTMDIDRNGKIDAKEFVAWTSSRHLRILPSMEHELARRAELLRMQYQQEEGSVEQDDQFWFVAFDLARNDKRGENSVAQALLADSGWATEAEAAQNNAITHKIWYDDRKVGGKEGAYIVVQERYSGVTKQEKIPNFLKTGMSVMYGNDMSAKAAEYAAGVLRKMTEGAVKKYNSPSSLKDVPAFIAYHELNMEEAELPLSAYKNFNEFFYRKLKPTARPIAEPTNPRIAVIPADSRCTVFPSFEESTRLWIKGEKFTLTGLLGDPELAKKYVGGCTIVITRLAPQDYHRCHFATGGVVRSINEYGREYFTVNPVAVRSPINVYVANKRNILVQESHEFGTVAYCVIGATMVGSIGMSVAVGQTVKKGDEINYFAFGGSTLITIFEPNKIQVEEDLLRNSQVPIETLVKVGQPLGRSIGA
eukprot:NODE_1451_length_1949_cov_47.895400_g1230_i0.p1 GENE.NODE_1451_length_1949_cov_47.895400_g1230_i0~~NODE_1451_length_1949_cov_47.895400_g1230_i0.p1  ORF type:complete len:613 (+),score=144.67 NODE_1451_length_1949_cov_47.895400_g1230_i0:56-1840(+)